MAKSSIINPVAEQEKKQALALPHNLFVADELLAVNIDASNATVSLGVRNPIGQIAPVLTLKMPLLFTVELAQKILEEAKAKKDQIQAEHKELYKLL